MVVTQQKYCVKVSFNLVCLIIRSKDFATNFSSSKVPQSGCVLSDIRIDRNGRQPDIGKLSWQVMDGKYLPIKTDKTLAPASLLKVIRCGCKKDCAAKKYMCRKYGLQCSTACIDCRGTSCTNSPPLDLHVELDATTNQHAT